MTGPAYDLTFCEIRDTSLVVEWKAPVYTGASAVAGYVVEYAKAGSDSWTAANAKAVSHRYLKVMEDLCEEPPAPPPRTETAIKEDNQTPVSHYPFLLLLSACVFSCRRFPTVLYL